MSGRSRLKIAIHPVAEDGGHLRRRRGGRSRRACVEAADREGHTGGGGDHDRRRPGHDYMPKAGGGGPPAWGRQRGRGLHCRRWQGRDLRRAPRARRAARRRARPRNLRHSAGRPRRRSLGSDFLGRPLGLLAPGLAGRTGPARRAGRSNPRAERRSGARPYCPLWFAGLPSPPGCRPLAGVSASSRSRLSGLGGIVYA